MSKINIYNDDIKRDVDWLYKEIKSIRNNFESEVKVKTFFDKIQKKIDNAGICSPKVFVDDILRTNDKEKRKKYVKLANKIAINSGMSNSAVHQMLVNASRRFLIRDYTNPIDALVSKDVKKLAKRVSIDSTTSEEKKRRRKERRRERLNRKKQ